MKSSHNNLRLLLEAKNDHIEIERLLDLVFTPRRTLLSSYQLRNSANKVNNLSYVIKDYSKKVVALSGLGPLAVHPIFQGEGLGEKLVSNSIEKAHSENWNWIVLVGDLSYYSKFGFSKDPTRGVSIGSGFDNSRLLGLDINGKFLKEAVGSLIRAN